MKAKLTISGNGAFTLALTPETEAERAILKRVGEVRELMAIDHLRHPGYWHSEDRLEIFPAPKEAETK